LEEVKGFLQEGTPTSWLQETLEEELWEEEQFQQGHTPLTPRSPNGMGLSDTSGLASNPVNKEIVSSSGASEDQDILFSIFFNFFPQKT
jgi:hypothetical protein